MAQADRLLDLLALLSARPHWSAADLAVRLEITQRTVRRDVARLRMIGYPVEAAPGLHGGYALGAGARMPPLVLSEDEAVAVAVGLSAAVGTGSSGLEESAVSALSKLDRILPAALRERVRALRQVAVALERPGLPAADSDRLVQIAVAAQRGQRVRFDYADAQGIASRRLVEPFRLVFSDRRWYMVCFDVDRDDWRTFRLDRMSSLEGTGQTFTRGDVPDAVALVAHGFAIGAYADIATVRLAVGPAVAAGLVPRTVGVVVESATTQESTTVRIGGEPEWVARYLAGLDCPFEVLGPESVRSAVRALGRRLVRRHPVTAGPD